jgi:DNA polymerase-3 subunit epsilon
MIEGIKLLFIDTETGGTNVFENSLLQLGLVATVTMKDKIHIIDQKEFNLKLENYNIESEALEYNKIDIHNEIYKKGFVPEIFRERFMDFMSDNFFGKKIDIVGHNVAFDKYFLDKFLRKFNDKLDNYVSHRPIDTMTLLWNLYLNGKIPYSACSSTGAFDYFGIIHDGDHRALNDCLSTIKLFEKLINFK